MRRLEVRNWGAAASRPSKFAVATSRSPRWIWTAQIPPILILDEPTSALDADTESQLLEALGRLMAGDYPTLIARLPQRGWGPSWLDCMNRDNDREVGIVRRQLRGRHLFLSPTTQRCDRGQHVAV